MSAPGDKNNQLKLTEHFDVCIFRFASLHSWFKMGLSLSEIQLEVVPVYGHEQEVDDPWVPKEGISWHFMPKGRQPEYHFPDSDAAKALADFLTTQSVTVSRGEDFYFDQWQTDNGYRFPQLSEKELQATLLVEKIKFAREFKHFHGFYEKCLNALHETILFLGDQDLSQVLPRFHPIYQSVLDRI